MLGANYLSSSVIAGIPWLNGLSFKVVVNDSIDLDDNFDRIVDYVKTLNDTLSLVDYQQVFLYLFKRIDDSVSITDDLSKSFIKGVYDNFTITDNEWLDFVKNGFTWNKVNDGTNIFNKEASSEFVFSKQEDGNLVFVKENSIKSIWDDTIQDHKK